MKSYKRPNKTEQSDEKQQKSRVQINVEWIQLTNYKKRKIGETPIRFADITKRQKINEIEYQSTIDGQSSNNSDIRKKRVRTEVAEAIDVLKWITESDQKIEKGQQLAQITPFQLSGEDDQFQQELSFKGANNRLFLMKKISQIQQKTRIIFQTIKGLNQKSNIRVTNLKKDQQQSKLRNMKCSYLQFYSFLESITKKMNDFVVELNRCRTIMNRLVTGISLKTVELYVTKFQNLIQEMESNAKYLENYIDLLVQINKHDKKITKQKKPHFNFYQK